VGDLNRRVASLEQKVAPGKSVTEDQASQISQAVKAVALVLTKRSGSNQFGGGGGADAARRTVPPVRRDQLQAFAGRPL
jgi:hypothetical protein